MTYFNEVDRHGDGKESTMGAPDSHVSILKHDSKGETAKRILTHDAV